MEHGKAMRGERIIACELEAHVPHVERPLRDYSPAQRAGIYYERRVSKMLLRTSNFWPQIAFKYHLKYEIADKHAILDGLRWQLHKDEPALTVIEIKHQLTEQAYKQLDFYMQLVSWWSGLPVDGFIICCYAPLERIEERKDISVVEVGIAHLRRYERAARQRDTHRVASERGA